MTDQDQQPIEALYRRAKRQLDLIFAIDNIRDTAQDPASMLGRIVNLVAEEFGADLAMLVLADRETGELELRALNDRSKRFGVLSPDSIRGLSQRAMRSDRVEIWEGQGICDALGVSIDCDMQMAIVPIILTHDKRLGALLVAREARVFSEEEIALLHVVESQLDSAVIQGYDYYELDLRNAELETVYRVDRIRDRQLAFDEMLGAVLEELRSAIRAEMGFIMLYNHTEDSLELRAVSHDDLFGVSGYYNTIREVAEKALRQAELVYSNELDGELQATMCIPLILRDEILGVFGAANSGQRGFEERDRRLLRAIASQMDTAIFENLEQRRLKRVLGRSVDPRVMTRLLANPDVDFLKGERQPVTVLYADIRGSTALAERTAPEPLVGFINEYLGRMADVILRYEGTLDKFVGDEVMALFNAPFEQPDHALRAVRVALEMQIEHAALVEKWLSRGVDAQPIGIGIATGEAIAGEMGSQQRTDYTVIGRPANLGARICANAPGGQVLISQETYDAVQAYVEAEPVTGLQMKGISGDVVVYRVRRFLE